MNGLDIEWSGERLRLFADRALHWPAREALIIADPHFGKAAAFRSAGVPTPRGTTQRDLARLDALLDHTRARRLIVLGDFLHARAGRERSMLAAVRSWRANRRELDITLVRGNHDRHAGDPPRGWRIRCVDAPLVEGSLTLCHDPDEAARCGNAPAIAGHVHPCVTLHDETGHAIRARCFHFTPRLAILPAFGSFTGRHRIRPARGERVFVIGENDVIEASCELRPR